MESLLNFAWVLIAVFAIAYWRTHRITADDEGHRPIREATALGCVLVFLFFAVSMTDDLHAAVLSLEEGRGKQDSIVLRNQNGGNGHASLPFVPASSLQKYAFHWARLGILILPAITLFSFDASPVRIGRAPPAFFPRFEF